MTPEELIVGGYKDLEAMRVRHKAEPKQIYDFWASELDEFHSRVGKETRWVWYTEMKGLPAKESDRGYSFRAAYGNMQSTIQYWVEQVGGAIEMQNGKIIVTTETGRMIYFWMEPVDDTEA